jgi:hypothetical protein
LVGSGGTWLLFDISYYGTIIFQPSIVQAIFPGDADSLTDAFFWQNLAISLMGLVSTTNSHSLLHLLYVFETNSRAKSIPNPADDSVLLLTESRLQMQTDFQA